VNTDSVSLPSPPAALSLVPLSAELLPRGGGLEESLSSDSQLPSDQLQGSGRHFKFG
jgi:hypothetical protein